MMPVDVFLTPRRYVLIIFAALCFGILIASYFAADLEDTTLSTTAGVSSRLNHVNTESDRYSSYHDLGPIPGAASNHLHWFVQISDLHVSVFYDSTRVSDLYRFCEETLKVVSPAVVLVTGDITDAKLEDREGSRQFEDEWKQYDRVLHESGILDRVIWLDVRGNHDTFNVPSLTSNENYFRVYSARGKHHTRSYQYLYKALDDDVISFIAMDACPNPGPKRPFNFFGLLEEPEKKRLLSFVNQSQHAVQTIFFGHYPTSTIINPVTDVRNILRHGSVYLCGHLHTLGGVFDHMYARQKTGYLELELADWKDQRVYRILAVDHGLVSFTDVRMNSWPVVLITNPKNGQYLLPDHEPVHRIAQSTHIRILAFSPAEIESVHVRIDGTDVDEATQVMGPLYVLPWQPDQYSSGQHVILVSVKDVAGNRRTVKQRFTTTGNPLPAFDIFERFVLMSDLTTILKATFMFCLMVVILPLVAVKFFRIHVQIAGQTRAAACWLRFTLCWLRRLYLVSLTPSIFYPLLFYNIYIAIGPWFIAEIIEGHIGVCFVFGIYVKQTFIPTALTYLYGTFQLLLFSIPLSLYLGRCLDISTIRRHRDTVDVQNSDRFSLVVWLFDHSSFIVIIGFQIYLILSGWYRSYGGMAVILCPLRTWAIVMAVWLRRRALDGCSTARLSPLYRSNSASDDAQRTCMTDRSIRDT